MRMSALFMLTGLTLWTFALIAAARGYPEASLDQATLEVKNGLGIERCQGLDDGGLQAEYQWALDMAQLCLDSPESIRNQAGWWSYAIEFQRHAGRIARYQGFGEHAIEDYEIAIEYIKKIADMFPQEFVDPEDWVNATIARDIADTYLMMGDYETATKVCEFIAEYHRQRGLDPLGSPPELNRLAEIAQHQGRFAEVVALQRQTREAEHCCVERYLQRHPDLAQHLRSHDWPTLVRNSHVQRALENADKSDLDETTSLRQGYYSLARALRLNAQHDDAEYALRTAVMTPWESRGTYRERQDLYVDREWAWLALDRGKAEEARDRARTCLEEHKGKMSQAEGVELLDLASRALEQLGDLQAAFDKLTEAIEIVEARRANLIADEHKQCLVASYAPLYRRATELSVRLGQSFNDTFRWSERAKGRAMLDAVRRLDFRMARAIDLGNAEVIRQVRDLAGEMVTPEQLQNAAWFDDDLALLEYTLGAKQAYLWVVTCKTTRRYTLPGGTAGIEENARRLAQALRPDHDLDDAWVKPASRLYEWLIEPAEGDLKGVSRLVIVGDVSLRTIPFETLVVNGNGRPSRKHLPQELLVEQFAVSYAPSANLLHVICSREAPTTWEYDFWGVACSKFGKRKQPPLPVGAPQTIAMIIRSGRELDDLPDLPNAPYEIRAVGEEFPDDRCRVLVDEPDVKSQLLQANSSGALEQVRFLHFATHAIAPSDKPYLAGLVLGPPRPTSQNAATQPSAGLKRNVSPPPGGPVLPPIPSAQSLNPRADLLNLAEIRSLELGSELVVLSACDTIGSEAGRGDWITGLTRSFLLTGARGVICTLWAVRDNDALMLMPGLYGQLLWPSEPHETGNTPRALQRVKTICLHSPMLCHPAIWSGIVYYGPPTGGIGIDRSCTGPTTVRSSGSSTAVKNSHSGVCTSSRNPPWRFRLISNSRNARSSTSAK